MTALSVGASLTWYHSRYPTFDGAKVLLKMHITKKPTMESRRQKEKAAEIQRLMKKMKKNYRFLQPTIEPTISRRLLRA